MRGKQTTVAALGILAVLLVIALTAIACGGEEATTTTGEPTETTATGETYTIGITQIVSHPALDSTAQGFIDALAEAGYVEGENVTYDKQNAQGEMANATTIAQKFAGDQVDLILSIATPTSQAAVQATTDIPIIFAAVTDPVAAGLVVNEDAPEANVTGVSDMLPVQPHLDLLMQLVPDAKTIGLLYNAGETKNPSRTIPLGLIAGCGLVTFLYIVTNVAYLYAVPAGAMAQADRIAADAMNAAVGPLGASIVAFIILFSIMGAANGHVLTGPRVYYAMAKDGLFFRKMGEVHPKYRTPHVSLLIVGAWSIALSLGPSGKFEELLKFAVFGAWIFLGLAVFGVFILRRKRPDLPRPYKTFGYPVTPAVFVLAALFVLINTLVKSFWNSFASLAIIALGIPAYLYWNKKRRRTEAGTSL